MKNIVNKGQVMSMIIYALYGIATLIGILNNDAGFNSFAIAALFFWGITIIIMTLIRLSDLRHSFVYKALYILSVCVFAVSQQIYFQSVYLIFIEFAILWLTIITFLEKKCFHFALAVQACCLLFLVLIPSEVSGLLDYSFMSWVFSCCGFLVADWVGSVLIGIFIQLDEETQEHDRSLDDLLDIVEAKHHEAVQATMAKSNFLSTMSHELRTPLNAIIGMNEMILRENKDEGIVEYARDIKASGNMMLSLVNDILDLSKIESNKMVLVPTDFDMSSLVRDITNMIGPKMQDKGLDFMTEIAPELLRTYHGDDVRLKQVLVNLLNNAAKYTKEGSVTFSISGKIENQNANLHFSVKDTGIGIKSEDLAKLNKKFVRLDEEKNRNIEGTGLGITIVNGFLKLMNSELKVESQYGKGSDFYFDVCLPCASSSPKIVSQSQNTGDSEVFEAEDMRVLVVDDTPINIKVFTALLKKNKVNIDSASSGFEGIKKAQKDKYDVIFLDMMMPEMDGVETLKRMKEIVDFINKDTPVVALTADAVAGAKQTYLDKGFDDYLAKPIVPKQLEDMLKLYWGK